MCTKMIDRGDGRERGFLVTLINAFGRAAERFRQDSSENKTVGCVSASAAPLEIHRLDSSRQRL